MLRNTTPQTPLPWREGMVGRGPGWWYDTLTFTLWSKVHYSTGRALSHRGRGGLVINVYSGEWIGYEQVSYEIWRR